jgi:hypothetical protein
MLCDFSVSFKDRGMEEQASQPLIEAVARRLNEMHYSVERVFPVEGSPAEGGISGSVESEDPKAAADQICEVTARALRHLGLAGWNVICGAWPHKETPTAA